MVGPSASSAAAHEFTKHLVENIGEAGAKIGSTSSTTGAAVLECSVPITIVRSALFVVFQNFVGEIDLIKLLLCLVVPRVTIRMIFHR